VSHDKENNTFQRFLRDENQDNRRLMEKVRIE